MPGFSPRIQWLFPCVLISAACDPGAFRSDAKTAEHADARQDVDASSPGMGAPDAGEDPPRAGRNASGAGAGASAGKAGASHSEAGSRAGQGGSAQMTMTTSGAGAAAAVSGNGGSRGGIGGSAGAAAAACERADPDAAVQLISTRDMGTVSQPASVAMRVPGPITWNGGGKLVWLFPKSVLRMPQTSSTAPANHPTAAFVDRKDPTALEESLIAGVPAAFVAMDAMRPDAELWPTGLLRLPADDQGKATTGAVAILQRVAADFSYDVLTTRLPTDALSTQAALSPLFTGDDPKFSDGAYRGADYSYLFACTEDASVADKGDPKHFPCNLARAPNADVEKRDSWRVYHPSDEQWLADLKSGAPVLYGPSNTFSVSYNNYLGRYLAVYSRWFSNDIVVLSAPRVVGPWRTELTIGAPTPVEGVVGFALEQTALNASDCETAIWISYFSPTASSGGFPSAGEIRLLQAELK